MTGKFLSGAAEIPAPESEQEAHLLELIRAADTAQRPPQLGFTLRPGPGGLYLPEGALSGPAPIDLVQVYATAEDILGFEPGPEWLMRTLDHTNLSDVLQFAATWTARAESIGAEWSNVDRAFAEQYLTGDALNRAKAILSSPRRRLVVPQALLVMIKIALFRCGRAEHVQENVNLLPAVLLAIASGLNPGERGSSPGRIVGEMVANQHFNNRSDFSTNMALYEARWHNPEYADGMPSLAEVYEGATGISLDDVAAVILATWARIESDGTPYFNETAFKDALDSEPVARVLDLISATPERLRQEIEYAEATGETRWNSVPWNFSPFERYPLIKHDAGWYVISPRYLLNRLLTWMPVFDVRAAMEAEGLKKDAARFETRVRSTTERYVQDVVAGTYEQLPGRVYTEVELRSELGRQYKVADVSIDYGHSWVVAEISTRRLMRETAHGGAGVTLDDEVDALCRKFEQIHSTVRRIRDTKFRTRSPGDDDVRFYPVLILTEGYPVNPFILGRLHEVLQMKNILTGRDVATPEVIDISDLEAVESLAKTGGPTLIDIIRSKQEGPFRLVDLTSHIRNVMHLNPMRPERVKGASDRVFARVINLISPQSDL